MRNPYRQYRAWLVPAALALGICGIAQATPPASNGPRLYAPCVVCHQPNAWGSPDGLIPSLAGQQQRYLEKQLLLFHSGARVDMAMQVVAAHTAFENQDKVVTLARYLATLEPDPHPVQGSGKHLRVGQELYAHICAACHGAEGTGDAGNRVPRIAGQHYPYLRRQVDAVASSHKELAPPEMISALRSMRPQEMDALADYISRLGNSEALLDLNSPDGAGKYPPTY